MNARIKEPGIAPIGPGKYRVNIRIRIDGKIVERRETVEGTREEARERRQQLKRELREKRPAGSLKCPFQTFADALRLYREKRGPFSAKYAQNFDALGKEIGDYPLEGFADRFEVYMRLRKTIPSTRGILRSPSSINMPLSMVKAVFTLCYDLELIKINPITKARFPRMETIPRDITISGEDRKRLIDAALQDKRTAHLADVINYAMQVPIRRSELVNMKVEDIDLFSVPASVRIRNGTTKNDMGT